MQLLIVLESIGLGFFSCFSILKPDETRGLTPQQALATGVYVSAAVKVRGINISFQGSSGEARARE